MLPSASVSPVEAGRPHNGFTKTNLYYSIFYDGLSNSGEGGVRGGDFQITFQMASTFAAYYLPWQTRMIS